MDKHEQLEIGKLLLGGAYGFIPCPEACKWIKEQGTYDLQALWEICPNGQWMDFFLWKFDLYRFLDNKDEVVDKIENFCIKHDLDYQYINPSLLRLSDIFENLFDLVTDFILEEYADLFREIIPNIQVLLDTYKRLIAME